MPAGQPWAPAPVHHLTHHWQHLKQSNSTNQGITPLLARAKAHPDPNFMHLGSPRPHPRPTGSPPTACAFCSCMRPPRAGRVIVPTKGDRSRPMQPLVPAIPMPHPITCTHTPVSSHAAHGMTCTTCQHPPHPGPAHPPQSHTRLCWLSTICLHFHACAGTAYLSHAPAVAFGSWAPPPPHSTTGSLRLGRAALRAVL